MTATDSEEPANGVRLTGAFARGNRLWMLANRLLHLATHPLYFLRRVAYRVYEVLHPDEPWISQGAIRFCEQRLRPDMRAVETGSGRSTAWFAQRVGELTSVEHHKGWHDKVQAKLRGLATSLALLKSGGGIHGITQQRLRRQRPSV
jgi:hypothetical protein